MINDITDFLPIYPNITDKNFNMSIYSKKEFYDEKLQRYEAPPKEPGTLLQAQKILSRFLSSYTPYNAILVKWELGTGKTCASVGAIEKIKNEKSIYNGAIVLAKGDTLLDNYKNDIVHTCTSGYYIPKNFKNLTKREQLVRVKKNLKEFYQFFTFEIFIKNEISKTSDDYIKEKYSNKIIVIDEVHNIRQQDNENKKKQENYLPLYDNFHRFLHTVENCKIILLSGTPIKDSIDETADIMNLILPMNKQLPTGKIFIKEFFNKEDERSFKIKENKIPILKDCFKGRISYLESVKSEVKKIFIGEKMANLKHFIVYPDFMSDFQTINYNIAYGKDVKPKEEDFEEDFEEDVEKDVEEEEKNDGAVGVEEEKKGIYKNSRQAALFIFPDGSTGKKGFMNSDYIKIIEKKTYGALKTEKKISLGTELNKLLNGKTNEEKLLKLEKYSSKYASLIRNILDTSKNKQTSFVYCEYVKGSGSILLGLILNLFGFKRYTGNEDISKDISKGLRYAVINREITPNSSQIQNIKERFNKPENMYGEYVNLIIGSRVIGEGISLMNIQNIHILTPHWNYSETAQAIGRGYRFGSHKNLIAAGIIPEVKIYQYVSIPETNIYPSIDIKLYEISEAKDLTIKGIEQLMKESSFDCALNFERNYNPGNDNTRECNYTNCTYSCDDVIMNDNPWAPIDISKLDLSSYQIYYNEITIKKIVNEIKKIFQTRFSFKLSYLQQYFKEYSLFDLITSLRTIINDNIIIHNKYGIDSYLREENDIYFIVDSISNENNYFSKYYNEFPITTKVKLYTNLLDEIYYAELPEKIKKIFSTENEKELFSYLSQLHLDLKEIILESSIKARDDNINKNIFQREKILEYFDYALENIDDVLISSLIYRDKNVLRCFIDNEWDDCSENFTEIYKENKKRKKESLKTQNEYFGTYNTDKFCIIKSNFKDDKRKENKGKVCSTWKKPVLIHIIVNILKAPLEIVNKTKWNSLQKVIKEGRDELIDKIINNKNAKICDYNEEDKIWIMDDYTDEILKEYSDDDLVKIYYYSNITVEKICSIIKDWFDNNNILTYDENCGTSNKKM